MPLPSDPDTFKIPAFMRKRSIKTRLKKPLLLTALDRKKAGVVLPELKKKKTRAAARPRKRASRSKMRNWPLIPEQNELWNFEAPTMTYEQAAPPPDRQAALPVRKKRARKIREIPASKFTAPNRRQTYKTAARKPKRTAPSSSFAEPFIDPIIDFPVLPKKRKKIGTVTHYYDKIQVGVIKLSAVVSVGDCIIYETIEGLYEQIVESMEIDREPVFKAGRGKEIGLKLSRIPRVGGVVFIA